MIKQDNIQEKAGQVSSTLADTLSNSEEQNLRKAVSNGEDHIHSALSTFRRCVKKHPVKTAGIAVLGGLVISSIIKRKMGN